MLDAGTNEKSGDGGNRVAQTLPPHLLEPWRTWRGTIKATLWSFAFVMLMVLPPWVREMPNDQSAYAKAADRNWIDRIGLCRLQRLWMVARARIEGRALGRYYCFDGLALSHTVSLDVVFQALLAQQ